MNNDMISRKALLKELKEWYSEAKQREAANYEWETFESGGIESAMLCVENFPAINAEPVRHSYWDDSSDGITPYCSVCGMSHNCLNRTPGYCPNCGAKMDGGTKTDVRND